MRTQTVPSSCPFNAFRPLLSKPRTTSAMTCSGTSTRGASPISSISVTFWLSAEGRNAAIASSMAFCGADGFKNCSAALAPQSLQKRASDVPHVPRLFEHLLQILAQGSVLLAFLEQHFDPSRHNRQRIVELVHEAGRELAQESELMA